MKPTPPDPTEAPINRQESPSRPPRDDPKPQAVFLDQTGLNTVLSLITAITVAIRLWTRRKPARTPRRRAAAKPKRP